MYDLTRIGDFSKDYGLRDQIRRAAGSVMHNIAEGFDAGSNAEFIRFLRYALRSASEVQSQLYLALDLGYLHEDQFQRLFDKVIETKKQLHGFIAYLVKNKSHKSIGESNGDYQLSDGQEENF